VVHRTQKPLRIVGDVSVAQDRIAIDALHAELDGGAVEGHIALRAPRPPRGTRVEAALKAERLDLDAATAFLRSLAGPDAAWPDEAAISLDIGQAKSAGQDLKPLVAKFGYGPKTLSLDELKFGAPGGATIEGSGTFDRTDTTGHLTLAASGSALSQITGMVAPVAPAFASRLEQVATVPGPAKLKLQLDIGKSAAKAGHADAHAAVELNAPQVNGTATVSASPELKAVQAFDLAALGGSDVNVETKLSATRGDTLLALLGLDHAVAGGDGATQFEGSASGAWHAPLRLSGKLWGANIDAEAQGTAEPWAQSPNASVSLKARSVNLAPLFGLKPADPAAQNIRLFARATLAGNKLALDDIDSVAAGSRLRGRLGITLDDEHAVDGAVGLDSLDLAPAFALAIGAAGRDPTDPLGTGLMKGWHGRVTFEALRGALAGGGEVRPISGAIKSDGQSLTFEQLKGKIGGGDASASIDVRPDPNGIVVNSRIDFAGVDGAALRYRGLKMPAGRTSLQMTLMSRGRSVAALAGALSGSGTMTLQSASIPGLDPRIFDVAIRASDAGQVTDDNRLRQLIAPVMAAGSLPIATAQIPFNIRDGRLRIDATTLESTNAHVIISGGYDMLADQADVRLSFSANSIGSPSSRPEIQLFAAGTPDALNPMLDVTSLSSWLAVRTIDRETRRLDAIERGEPQGTPPATPQAIPRAQPAAPPPVAPPSTAALPAPVAPPVARPVQPPPAQPQPGQPAEVPARDPRQLPPRATTVVPPQAPRRPAVPPQAPPVISQQAAPLPPPIEVRPAPGYAPPRPKPSPRPPLVLTPPAVNQ
jgi:AsmA-like C-terminal region